MVAVEIIGNLGADAEMKEVVGKNCIVFNVAHSERYKCNGQVINQTQWFSASWFISKENGIFQYLKKGTQVFIRGSLSANTYTAKNGSVRIDLKVTVRELKLLGTKNEQQTNNVNNQMPF